MLNLPNTLTVGRFCLIPIYFLVFYSDLEINKQLSFVVVLLAGFTDVADGFLARKYNIVTQFGAILDPLADKMLLIAVLISFMAAGMVSWWAAAVFFIRDFAMIIGTAICQYRKKKAVPANIYGKVTTVLFYLSFFLIMFRFPSGELFLWGVIFFSMLTSCIYIVELKKMDHLRFEP